MKKRFLQMISLSLSLMMVFALTGVTTAFAEDGQAPDRAARTILLYCSGHQLESPTSDLMSRGLNRMMQNEIPDGVNVIVLTGGAMCWNESLRLDGAEAVNAECNQVWKMTGARDGKDGALVPVAPEGIKGAERLPMNDPAMLRAFLDYGYENYPADRYDLVLCGHGSGPVMGWCGDEQFQRADGKMIMSVSEICSALRDSRIGRFSLVTFYACLMGNAEVAAAFSPYTDNLVISSENLNGMVGMDFSAMFRLLAEDPRADGYAVGKQIADATAELFAAEGLFYSSYCTLTVLNTGNYVRRLVPKLAELAKLMREAVTVPDRDGRYSFCDEVASVRKAIEFSNGMYQLRDLGNIVSELGINYTEYSGEEDLPALVNSENRYTALSVEIMNILTDSDMSGDDVLYHRSSESVSKQTGQTFRRDREGKLCDSGDSFFRTTGLSLYFDLVNSFTASLYSEQIDGILTLEELDSASRSFLADHRDTVLLYSLILSSGRAVFELKKAGKTGITAEDVFTFWKDNAVWEQDNTALEIRNTGLGDLYGTLKRLGYDADGIIAAVIPQQDAEMMTADSFAVYRREEAGSKGETGSLKVVAAKDLYGQADSVNMRLRILGDYDKESAAERILAGKYASISDRLLIGGPSSDDLARLAFRSETPADYVRAVSAGREVGSEIPAFDGNYYVLTGSRGNSYLVQYEPNESLEPKAQIPVFIRFSSGKSVFGQIEFAFDGNGESHATGFVPADARADFANGIYPLSDTVFDGATVTTVFNTTEGAFLGNRMRLEISEEIPLTDDASRGIVLRAVPISEIPQILGYEIEYYIRDIYGNEIVLPVNDSTPVLRNIANAIITPDGPMYGESLLTENVDYERYGLSDGGTVFFGIGHYTGMLRIGE